MNQTAKHSAPAVQKQDTKLSSTLSFDAFAGQGFENVKSNDLIIPRITILQGLSPQIQPKKAEYVAGAKVGDICDVGTGEIFESPLLFLPVFYMKQYLEWAPRASGKGLVAIHDNPAIIEQTKSDENNRPVLPNGNYISETAQFFGLNLSAGGRRSFLPMSSTQLKIARKWLTLATAEKIKRPDGSEFSAPLFYRTYQLSTVENSNNKGDWIGFKVERGPTLQEYDKNHWETIFKDVLDFRDSLVKGHIRGDVAEAEEQHSGGERAM